MAITKEFEEAIAILSARIDEISTNLMVEAIDGSSGEALRLLARDAEQIGLNDTARIARTGADRIAQENTPDASLKQSIFDSLDEIRRSLDTAGMSANGSAGDVSNAPDISEDSYSASIADDPELISDFLVESREHLTSIESQMLALEKNPGSTEVIHAIFRSFHTIKGLAGFLEFTSIVELAHDVEGLLDLARKGIVSVDPQTADVVLESADYLKGELNRIEARLSGNAAGGAKDNRGLRARICSLAHPVSPIAQPPGGELPAAEPARETEARSLLPDKGPEQSELSIEPGSPPPSPSESVSPLQPAQAEVAKGSDSGSVRVDTAKLDHLLEMVGEMVIAQSLIRNNPALAMATDSRLQADIAQLSRSAADIQRTTMSMRMVPIGQLFQRSARLIRDLSRKSNKVVVLETFGEDTEVDKKIAEELADPLLHMVRNSVDHGVESSAERRAAGKDATAHVRLKAYHQAGHIVIEISDDGRGLNHEKILAKAMKSGLVASGEQLSENEIFSLIFEPGFSTSDKVSDVSGRGVGMDVVRRNVQKLRGRIEIQSTPGQGTTFVVRLPLTLAIIDGLVVIVGKNRYVVPVFTVKEMFRPTVEMLSTVTGRGEMALVRGHLLPIVRLHRRFGIDAGTQNLTQGLLVVVEALNKEFCLFVDDLVGKQEIVIKSLGESFKDVCGLAGCAVLGDGHIGLILDMDGIYRGGGR